MAADRPGDELEPGSGSPSLEIGGLLSDGVDGLLSVTGAQLAVALTGLSLVSTVFWQSIFLRVLEDLVAYIRETVDVTDPEIQTAIDELEMAVDSIQPIVDVSIPVALLGILVLAIASEAVMIVAARAFADGALEGVPSDLATRRLLAATLYGFVGGILLMIAIAIGALFVLVPGVFIYVGTIFFRQEIAVADKGPLQAISGSWAMAKGHRWMLLALALVLFIIGYAVSFVVGYVPGMAGMVIATAANSTVGVFAIAVVTSAYVRLRGGDRVDTSEQPNI